MRSWELKGYVMKFLYRLEGFFSGLDPGFSFSHD